MTSINILKSFITSIIILFLNSSNHNYGATAFNSYRSKLQADEQISKSVPPKVHHTAKNYDSSYNREEICKLI